MRFKHDLKLLFRCWRRWVMTGRQAFPDIRQVALEDEEYDDDMWFFDLVVRYITHLEARHKQESEDDGE